MSQKRIPKLKLLSILSGVAMLSSCSTTLTPNQLSREKRKESSPQWREGRFHNTISRDDPSIWKILKKMATNSAQTEPEQPLPIENRRGKEFSIAPESGLRITWLGHSSVLLEVDGQRVLTDPVWSERASPFTWAGPKRFYQPPLPLEELPKLDAVVISHDHYDHLDQATIEALKDRIPLFAVPLGVGAYLEEWGVAPDKIVELDWWDDVRVGKLTLTATPARHFSGRTISEMNGCKTLWAGWSIAGPEHRIFFSGDTAMFPGFKDIGERLGPFDVTLMETGAYDALWTDVHLGPEQAVQAHGMVKGKLMFPVHWGTFDLANHSWIEPVERAIVAARLANVDLAIPRPGQSIEPSSAPVLARWWPQVPWQRVEHSPAYSTGLSHAFRDAHAFKMPPLDGSFAFNHIQHPHP